MKTRIADPVANGRALKMGFSSYVITAQAVAEALPDSLAGPADPQVCAEHAALFGDVQPEFATGIRLDAEFHARWLALAAAPLRGAAGLSPKEMHLIALVVHAQCTQLNAAGVRQHARAALAHGASHDEVLDVARLVSSMGIHAMVFALPLINELTGEQP